MTSRLGFSGCRRCGASLHQQRRPPPGRCLPPRPSPHRLLTTPHTRITCPSHFPPPSARLLSTASPRPSPPPPSSHPSLFPPISDPLLPPSPAHPPSPSPIDPLWLCNLSELRALLRYPLPLPSLFLIIQRFRTTFYSLCTPADTALLLHHLALHHRDTFILHSLTSTALLLYNDHLTRSPSTPQPPLPPSSLRDLLTLASLAGEGALCTHLTSLIPHPTIDDLNLQVWGNRADEQMLWKAWEQLDTLTAPLSPVEHRGQVGWGGVEGRVKATPASLLVLLHACGRGEGWLRFDVWLVLRGERFMREQMVREEVGGGGGGGGGASASTALLDHLQRYVQCKLKELRKLPVRIAWVDAARTLESISAEERMPALFKGQGEPRVRLALLYRWANACGMELPSNLMRRLLADADEEAMQQDEEGMREEEEKGAMQPQTDHSEQHPQASSSSAWPNSLLRTDLVVSPALFSDGLRAELRLRGESEDAPAVQDAVAAAVTAKVSWQTVLAAYEQQVSRGHPPVELSHSFHAIEACYRGKHWQRAVELLVMPLYTLLDSQQLRLLTSPTLHAQQPQPQPQPQLPAQPPPSPAHDDDDYIALSPITGRWSGPETFRVDWFMFTPSSPAFVPPSVPFSTLPLLCSSVLHFAFCIAAMDEAGNAESVAKADRLHAIALHHFPFLFHLYQPHSRTIHLVHPTLPPAYDAIEDFVQHLDRTRDRLWALLYLVWRLMRRRELGEARSEVGEVWLIEEMYEEGRRVKGVVGGEAGEAAVTGSGKRERVELQLRLGEVSEVATLRRVLQEGPWALKRGQQGWTWKQVELTLTEPAYPLLPCQRAEQRKTVPAFWTQPSTATAWTQGWQALLSTFSTAQGSDSQPLCTAPCLLVPSYKWAASVGRVE